MEMVALTTGLMVTEMELDPTTVPDVQGAFEVIRQETISLFWGA